MVQIYYQQKTRQVAIEKFPSTYMKLLKTHNPVVWCYKFLWVFQVFFSPVTEIPNSQLIGQVIEASTKSHPLLGKPFPNPLLMVGNSIYSIYIITKFELYIHCSRGDWAVCLFCFDVLCCVFVCLFVCCLFVCLFVPLFVFVCLFVCLFVFVCWCLFVCVCLFVFVCLSVCLFVFVCFCLFVFVCLFGWLFDCLIVCLFVCLFVLGVFFVGSLCSEVK